MTKKLPLTWALILCLSFLSACSSQTHKPPNDQPLSLQEATENIAVQLFDGINNNQGIRGKIYPKTVALDVMIDAHSQEQLLLNQQIVQHIKQVAKSYTAEPLQLLSRQSLHDSYYVFQSSIAMEKHPSASLGKLYHEQGIIRNARNGTVIARADAWISDKNLNYQRYPEFKDSPTYTLKKMPHPTDLIPHQRMSFGTLALLNEAGEAYANRQYTQAIDLYQAALGHPDGVTPRTYAGLYISQLRLGQNNKAEKSFEKLLALSFMQTKELALKILFQVGSDNFAGNAMTQEQYQLWVNKIATYLHDNSGCLGVTGHGSHSGSVEYNNVLSLKRADHIRDLMNIAFPDIADKIRTEGKGFSENIVGTGTDDERDALDRRIEFKLPPCHP